MFIVEKIKNWLNGYSYQTDLDNFISSRSPKNAADVDYLMRVWSYKKLGGWL